jgi:hypothetical protein
MSLCCLVFITLTTETPALMVPTYEAAPTQQQIDSTFTTGARVAYAVISMQESDVLWGLMVLSVAVAVFGSYVEALPGTDSEAYKQRQQAQEAASLPNACPNCGTAFVADSVFCHHCGQERIAARPLTMGNFIANAVPDVLNVDGRIFSTLRQLVTQPGYLTVEYWKAHRASHSMPLQLYAIIAAVFFFVSSNLDFTIDSIITQFPTLRLAERIQEKAAQTNIAPDIIKLQLSDLLENYLPLYTIVMVIVFALCLKIVYWRWRYVQHIVFSLHFISAFMLLWMTTIVLYSVFPPLKRFEIFVIAPALLYLFFALRRAYAGTSWLRFIPAALCFLLLFVMYTAVILAIGIILL